MDQRRAKSFLIDEKVPAQTDDVRAKVGNTCRNAEIFPDDLWPRPQWMRKHERVQQRLGQDFKGRAHSIKDDLGTLLFSLVTIHSPVSGLEHIRNSVVTVSPPNGGSDLNLRFSDGDLKTETIG